jgi:hypothetical protein
MVHLEGRSRKENGTAPHPPMTLHGECHDANPSSPTASRHKETAQTSNRPLGIILLSNAFEPATEAVDDPVLSDAPLYFVSATTIVSALRDRLALDRQDIDLAQLRRERSFRACEAISLRMDHFNAGNPVGQ